MAASPITEAMGIIKIMCKRCNISEATLQTRADPVCQKCFMLYITTKAVKRLETYKTRGVTAKNPKRLLLPLSFGPSSTCLLHILNTQLQGQLSRMSRTSYELVIVHINTKDYNIEDTKSRLKQLRMRFPSHKYIAKELEESLTLKDLDLAALGLDGYEYETPNTHLREKFQEIIASTSSVTSQGDVMSTLLLRLIVKAAKENGCDSVVFGDSTTRLAEKSLTEIAKGRGFYLPWQVSDGLSPHGVNFHYPLRDLLKKELLTYSNFISPPLTNLIIYQKPSDPVSASSKTTTIADLMAQYLQAVEENYPSIVANVVRTSSKLNPPPIIAGASKCSLCGLPLAHETNGIDKWGGDQSSHVRPSGSGGSRSHVFCYGCTRSISS